MAAQNTIAFICDCDDTLCPDTITFLVKQYGVPHKPFWDSVTEMVRKGWEPPLAYMSRIIDLVHDGTMPDLTNVKLREIGAKIQFFPGLPQFFEDLHTVIERDQEFIDAGVSLEFYVVTGGFEAMIRGSAIAPFMTDIFGSTFDEDPETHLIRYSKTAVTLTEKTKFVHAINKGIMGAELRRDPYRVNDVISENDRRIPFRNMIYVGDGPSDIPCFSLIQASGENRGSVTGHAVGVYKRGVRKGYELARGRRITAGPYSCHYSPGSDLRRFIERSIVEIASEIVRLRCLTYRRSARQCQR
jgi:2-hydroxy-3-keto-5-methylthiopentenyl-1-phosphate phosphatase